MSTYPLIKYHATEAPEDGMIIQSAAHEAKLGAGWAHSPAEALKLSQPKAKAVEPVMLAAPVDIQPAASIAPPNADIDKAAKVLEKRVAAAAAARKARAAKKLLATESTRA